MNKKQALAKAVKIFGKNAMVRDMGANRKSSPALREAAQKQFAELKSIDVKAMSHEQLVNYRERKNLAAYESHHYRFSVGKVAMGMFFSVEGSGDTWEEAFDAAEKMVAA